MKVDIDGFEVFECVVSEGSFAKAADKMNRAQSNISYQIAKLERQLGVALFDRSQYKAQLTSAGRAILVESQRLTSQASHIVHLADSYQAGWETHLMIVIDGALDLRPVMCVLRQLVGQDIPTKIVLKVEYLQGVQERFLNDEASLMLVKDYCALPSLVAEPLPQVTNYLCVAHDHPLALMRALTREQLFAHVELSVTDSSVANFDNRAHQFGGDKIFYFSSFADKKQAVLMGLGFGWLPEFLIERELADKRLVLVDIQGSSHYQFNPSLVYCDERPLGKAGRLFKALLVEETQKHLA